VKPLELSNDIIQRSPMDIFLTTKSKQTNRFAQQTIFDKTPYLSPDGARRDKRTNPSLSPATGATINSLLQREPHVGDVIAPTPRRIRSMGDPAHFHSVTPEWGLTESSTPDNSYYRLAGMNMNGGLFARSALDDDKAYRTALHAMLQSTSEGIKRSVVIAWARRTRRAKWARLVHQMIIAVCSTCIHTCMHTCVCVYIYIHI
jgi:hypothetical protein